MSDMIYEVAISLDKGWQTASHWLTERLGPKYLGAPLAKKGQVYFVAGDDLESSDLAWDVSYKAGLGVFKFRIKDRDAALLFKLTFGGV